MRVTRYSNLSEFAARVEPFLLRHEAEHCLPLGLLSARHAADPTLSQSWYMAAVEDDQAELALVALQTPPNNLILSLPSDRANVRAACHALASDARDACGALPGVIADTTTGATLANAWQTLTGETYHVGVDERIYRLTTVSHPIATVPGAMRRMIESDRALMLDWMRAFMLEALGQDTPVDDMVDRRLQPGSPSGMYLWDDGGVVSAAGYGSPTQHGIRIGPVYTPPAQRGRGYASALVADLSQRLLDEGRQFCFLFTDLANPTSNHIYQQIGYQPISDASELIFEPRQRAR